MMRKILTLIITINSTAWAAIPAQRDISEEALILNQEMQFLMDSAKDLSLDTRPSSTSVTVTEEKTSDLEDMYFSNDNRNTDRVQTKSAAPNRPGKRRRN